jgi:hypothetical protein
MPTKLLAYKTHKSPSQNLVGIVDGDSVAPLLDSAGRLYQSLYDVIEDWEALHKAGLKTDDKAAVPVADVDILPPLTGRDVLVCCPSGLR